MQSLVDFLMQRVAEDESGARLAAALADALRSQGMPDLAEWVARQCAHVLAECAAKRAIMEKRLTIGLPDHPIGDGQAWLSGAHEAVDAERGHILRTLAAVYADHPDYQQEWKPW